MKAQYFYNNLVQSAKKKTKNKATVNYLRKKKQASVQKSIFFLEVV